MPDGAVTQVRSFNRLVAQRIGALEDRYLSTDRPLGEARVLWEIGPLGCEVRELRSRLELDSGYLSRLLRSLEEACLVTVAANAGDRRVHTARLTAAGRGARRMLDRRSDELARSLLRPLNPKQRDRLVTAMGEVERLLTAALVEFDVVDPAGAEARECLREYFAELARRFATGFDPAVSHPLEPDLFVIATLRSEPVGCGALKLHGAAPAELRRMWVASSVRGMGLGRRLLGELEARAAAAGASALRLDTNRALVEAISLYRSAGYREIEPFSDEPYADYWFEKPLQHGRSRG
jgi:DNA-binding MarR family transcriptional regulator